MFRIYSARLLWRVVVFLSTLLVYLEDNHALLAEGFSLSNGINHLHILWIILVTEMMLKFIPLPMMSIGSRKHFRSTYAPWKKQPTNTEVAAWVKQVNTNAIKVVLLWLAGHIGVAVLYVQGLLGADEMLLLSLAYYVGDLVCILFYCPFQSLLMKNHCCATCRIFNWDCMMIVTPLIFVGGFFSWSLVFLALLVLVCWEYAFYRYPQRFFAASNKSLNCGYCPEEGLCRLKKTISNWQVKAKSRKGFKRLDL